jgi:TetR/AcrR family transcriptional repressor of bet genes
MRSTDAPVRPPLPRATVSQTYDERRDELSTAALDALLELGYARTSLREVASRSGVSHGVLTYYFSDMDELVLLSVSSYKAVCATRFDHVVASSTTPEQLVEGFLVKLGESLRNDALLHRLWYDVRARSMFDTSMRECVERIDGQLTDMVWRVMQRFSTLTGRAPQVSRAMAYRLVDGLFEAACVRFCAGERAEAEAELIEQTAQLLPFLFHA